MAAACLPSKIGSTSPKDSSLFWKRHKTSKTQPYSVWTTGHRQSLLLTLKSGFFLHFRNTRAGNAPRANRSGFGKWGTRLGLWQFTKPECGETNLQDLGQVLHTCPAAAAPSPSQVSRQSRCCARDSWSHRLCPAGGTACVHRHQQGLIIKVLKHEPLALHEWKTPAAH